MTRLLLEGIGPAHNAHCRYLQARFFLSILFSVFMIIFVNTTCTCMYFKKDFVAAQARYYSTCNAALQALQKELGSLSLQVSTSDLTMSLSSPISPGEESESRKARVLCDYDSQDSSELSLIAGEVFDIEHVASMKN